MSRGEKRAERCVRNGKRRTQPLSVNETQGLSQKQEKTGHGNREISAGSGSVAQRFGDLADALKNEVRLVIARRDVR